MKENLTGFASFADFDKCEVKLTGPNRDKCTIFYIHKNGKRQNLATVSLNEDGEFYVVTANEELNKLKYAFALLAAKTLCKGNFNQMFTPE